MATSGRVLSGAVIVAALGYFVDIYDLILFGVVREVSLADLGYAGDVSKGVMLINIQMAGMLLGGILWGIMGDRRGRISVLFGSIFLYSIANIANGFVQDINTYAFLRFIAGVGLAGELGAGITLVSETLPKEKRGLGTMVVVVFGALGAVLAALVGSTFGSWRTAYFVGGGLGLALLALRVGTYESGLFEEVKKDASVKRGAFLSLFSSRARFSKYLNCILIGVPVWYTIGILILFASNLAAHNGLIGVKNAQAIMFAYIGLSVGDLVSGLLSQLWKSRKKVILLFIGAQSILTIIYLSGVVNTLPVFYGMCFLLGAGTGFWALFVTVAAEAFGTNLRSTVTTTVPNFVRGAVVPLTFAWQWMSPSFGPTLSAGILGAISLSLAAFATIKTKETFGKSLDYIEP